MSEERILCAAIWYKEMKSDSTHPLQYLKNTDKGVVICGHRHGHCIAIMKSLKNKRTVTYASDGVGEFEQGFLTSRNRFVSREEAAEIAYTSKQIKLKLKTLYSEDIY